MVPSCKVSTTKILRWNICGVAIRHFWERKALYYFRLWGGLKNNCYAYLNKTYKLGRHGFAREREFLKSTSIGIVSDKTSHGLKLHYTDFPFMGIWAAKNAVFEREWWVEVF